MNSPISRRILAASIAAAAWTGLVVQFSQSSTTAGSPWLALWIIGEYFTILTNVLVAVVFTNLTVERGPMRTEATIAGTMLSIVLVGVVYNLLLPGAMELSGGSVLVDRLLHKVTPILVPIYWLLFVRKGGLTRSHPWLWAIYPLLYFVYATARGLATEKYAYPFLNVLKLGWQRTALIAFAIAVGFMISGYAVVWLDRVLSSRAARSPG